MAIAGNYGVGIMMNGGIIRVYGGTRPSSPDNAPGTTELARITTEGKEWFADTDPNSAGLVVKVVSPGALVNKGIWHLKGSATGTATWFRWCWAASDPQLLSTYYPRIDGDIGVTTAADLVLVSTSITAVVNRVIDSFTFLLPMGDA